MSAITLRVCVLLAAGAACIAAAAATFWWQSQTISRLEDRNSALEERSVMAEARAEASVAALIASESERLRAEKSVSIQAVENKSIRDELRGLQRKNVEVARNDPNSGARIPSAVADSLRMQHKTANRHAVRDHTGDAARVAHAGTGNTAPARRDGA